MTRRIPDLTLEKYVLGELDSQAARAEVERSMADDPETAARIAAIEASNTDVLAKMPPRVFAARVDTAARAQPSRGMWFAAIPLLAAAVALLAAVPMMTQPSDPGEIVYSKGDPMVFVHRQGSGDPEQLEVGATARRGDLLQLSYTASGAEFGAIFSVDGRGAVTWHLPRNGRQAVRLQGGASVPLDHSYELDDAPEFERFVFVTGPDAFTLSDVERVAKGWGGRGELRIDAPLRTTMFSVDKEGR